jgi:hypothetical protein
MQKAAFWFFLSFGIVTVLLAFLGGLWALFRGGNAGSVALGFLLVFLGTSLALMLGSLMVIKKKEKNSSPKGGRR